MRKCCCIFCVKQNTDTQTLCVAADDNPLLQMFSTYDSITLQVICSPLRFVYTSVISLELLVVVSQCAACKIKPLVGVLQTQNESNHRAPPWFQKSVFSWRGRNLQLVFPTSLLTTLFCSFFFCFFFKCKCAQVDTTLCPPPKHYIINGFLAERRREKKKVVGASPSFLRFTSLPWLSVQPSICCVWFRVIRHGNGGPGHEVIGSAEEGAGGCLLILW